MRKKLSTWKKNHLSFAGRIALINSVLSALPTFYMAIFRTPKGVIKKMDKIRTGFLWGNSQDNRVWAKVKWGIVCRPKKFGGLGITNLETRNKALLCKWWWRYAQEPESLWRKVIAALYGEDIRSWKPAEHKAKEASQVWGSILKLNEQADTRKVVGEENFRWVLGNGADILMWWDRWKNESPMKEQFPRLFLLSTKKLMKLDEAVQVYNS